MLTKSSRDPACKRSATLKLHYNLRAIQILLVSSLHVSIALYVKQNQISSDKLR